MGQSSSQVAARVEKARQRGVANAAWRANHLARVAKQRESNVDKIRDMAAKVISATMGKAAHGHEAPPQAMPDKELYDDIRVTDGLTYAVQGHVVSKDFKIDVTRGCHLVARFARRGSSDRLSFDPAPISTDKFVLRGFRAAVEHAVHKTLTPGTTW
jgi:hypothetical protein